MIQARWLRRARMARYAGIGLLTVAAVLVLGCSQEPALKVSLAGGADGSGGSSENWTCLGCKATPQKEAEEVSPHYLRSDAIRIAVSSMTMPRETFNLYEELLSYVGDTLGRRVELVQRKTYREANDLVEAQQVDVAFVCSLPYVLGHDRFGMELLVAPLVGGSPTYRSNTIVRADSGLRTFAALRGKSFAFMDPESNSGMLYPSYRLAQMGETAASFFRSHFYTFGHDNSINAVLDRIVDAAAVENLILDYMAARDPVVGRQIMVVERSPAFGIPPVVVHPDLDPQLKEKLRGIFLQMDGNERGRAILDGMNIEGFGLTTDEAYDSIREMYNLVRGQAGSR